MPGALFVYKVLLHAIFAELQKCLAFLQIPLHEFRHHFAAFMSFIYALMPANEESEFLSIDMNIALHAYRCSYESGYKRRRIISAFHLFIA